MMLWPSINKLQKRLFQQSLVESIPTSTTAEYFVGAGPECLSRFLNFQNNDAWLEVRSLDTDCRDYKNKKEEQGHIMQHNVERKLRDVGIMEQIP
jgi:hypothetical protein